MLHDETFIKHLNETYNKLMDTVKIDLEKSEFCCITADCWSCARRSLLGVTVHWLDEELKRHCKESGRRFENIARWCQITTQRCWRADERDESWNRWVQVRSKGARDKSEFYVQIERRHWTQLLCLISQVVVSADWHRESKDWEWAIRSLDLIVGRSSDKACSTNT